MEEGNALETPRGWNGGHWEYACRDGNIVKAPHRVTLKSDTGVQIAVPRSGVWYARDVRLEVSGVRFSRDTETLFCGTDGVRTLALSRSSRTVHADAFRGATSLRSVTLNESLQALGDGEEEGVFQNTGPGGFNCQ